MPSTAPAVQVTVEARDEVSIGTNAIGTALAEQISVPSSSGERFVHAARAPGGASTVGWVTSPT